MDRFSYAIYGLLYSGTIFLALSLPVIPETLMPKVYPLHIRGDRQKEEAYDALVEGVPDHLKESLTQWVSRVLWDDFNRRFRADYLRELERNLRVGSFDWRQGSQSARDSVLEMATKNSEAFLAAIDHTLRNWPLDDRFVRELFAALEEGGSSWTVQRYEENRFCLIRRMDESVKADVDAAIEKGGRAGEYLRDALVAIYGRNPNASNGYRDSVRAVEVAAIAVILPDDKGATLGKVIAELKADISKTKRRWKLALGVDAKVDPPDVLRSMLELLWTNHFDRHGTHDESVPLKVSLEQAETGFHLAITLVHWFATGQVTKT